MMSTLVKRYVFVGLANTAVGYGCILLLRYGLGTRDLTANAGGYVLGAITSYALNRNFTFRSQRSHLRTAPLFVASICACYALNAAILMLALHTLSWPSFAAQAAGMIAYNIAFFVLNKSLVFKH